jgi:hypothetical protein
MRHRSGWSLALATVLALVSAQLATASEVFLLEGRLEGVRASTTALTFTDEEETFRTVCELQTTLVLNGTIAATGGAAVGLATEQSFRACRGGTATVLSASASLTYVSWTGTLPTIESLRLQLGGLGVLLASFFGIARCLYAGSVQVRTARRSEVTELRVDESISLALSTTLAGPCPSRATPRGTLRLASTVRLGAGDYLLEAEPDGRTVTPGLDTVEIYVRNLSTNRLAVSVSSVTVSDRTNFTIDRRALEPPCRIPHPGEGVLRVRAVEGAATGLTTTIEITYDNGRRARVTVRT